MPTASAVETARMITVSQILDGDARCHCGAEAVLIVDTEPDNEPGATCYAHASEWLELTSYSIDRLFGPKVSETT